MGQTLTNGIYLPNEGERNCYSGLAANWNAVDTLKGNYSLHAINVDIHVTAAEKETWNGKADASALTAHTGDTTIHVTSADKQAWNGHVADTTIHVTSADKQAWNGHVADSVKHVTAADKAKWDAVTSKADDSDVVHKSGNETISGTKTFTDNNMIKTSSPKVLLINTSLTGNTAPSSYTVSFLRFDGETVNNFGGVQCEFFTTGENRLTNYVKDITLAKINTIQQRANSTTAMTVFNADLLAPAIDGVTALGSSSKRWSDVQTYKVNNLEPSSLSLPNFNKRIDISSYVTNLSGAYNAYTPSVDGWIAIQSSDATFIRIADTGSGGLGNTVTSKTAGTLTCMLPVRANRQNNIYIVCTTLTSAYFIPCQGNV